MNPSCIHFRIHASSHTASGLPLPAIPKSIPFSLAARSASMATSELKLLTSIGELCFPLTATLPTSALPRCLAERYRRAMTHPAAWRTRGIVLTIMCIWLLSLAQAALSELRRPLAREARRRAWEITRGAASRMVTGTRPSLDAQLLRSSSDPKINQNSSDPRSGHSGQSEKINATASRSKTKRRATSVGRAEDLGLVRSTAQVEQSAAAVEWWQTRDAEKPTLHADARSAQSADVTLDDGSCILDKADAPAARSSRSNPISPTQVEERQTVPWCVSLSSCTSAPGPSHSPCFARPAISTSNLPRTVSARSPSLFLFAPIPSIAPSITLSLRPLVSPSHH